MRKFMRTRNAPAHPSTPAHSATPAHSPHSPALHKTNGVTNKKYLQEVTLHSMEIINILFHQLRLVFKVTTDTVFGNHIRNLADGVTRPHHEHSTLPRYWCESEGFDRAVGEEGSGTGVSAVLFEDVEFPAAASSLGERRLSHHTRWLRPHEICPRPRFLGDTALDAGLSVEELEAEPPDRLAARWSLRPGVAGDALGVAAAALALTPRLLERAVPPHSFRTGYSGRFRFRFWVFGSWREVVVDDRLPTRAGVPLSLRGGLPDDFTLPLLEKAYAKLHGSYSSLAGAPASRALQELTGAVVQSFSPPRQPRALLLQVLHSAVPRSTLLVAAADEKVQSGLLAGQAYCVTGLARAGGASLVRVRAVGGHGAWVGAWSRGSPQWRALDEPDRDLLARRVLEPGHFWMSFSDFASSFVRLELAHVGPDDWLCEPALHARRPWRAVLARRRWRRGYNAGGAPPAPTAHANPQFHVHVRAGSGKCHVVVSVTQQYAVGARRRLHGIGFAVYELPPGASEPRAARAPCDLADLRALDVTHSSRAREVVTFFTLPPGRYLVVPHTHRPHRETSFLLRILTDEHTDVWEVNDDNVIIRDIATEFLDEGCKIEPEVQAAIAKVIGKRGSEEVDARLLRAVLRAAWRGAWSRAPSRALCGALVALRDPGVRGRLAARELPALLARVSLWRAAVRGAARCGRVSAYSLRALLWACGVRASNKVLECLVLRFARGAALAPDAVLLALARLHLAHERYRSLDTKLKSNPLSLEEMLLMTIYS